MRVSILTVLFPLIIYCQSAPLELYIEFSNSDSTEIAVHLVSITPDNVNILSPGSSGIFPVTELEIVPTGGDSVFVPLDEGYTDYVLQLESPPTQMIEPGDTLTFNLDLYNLSTEFNPTESYELSCMYSNLSGASDSIWKGIIYSNHLSH